MNADDVLDGDEQLVQTGDDFTSFVREHFGALRKKGGAGFRVLAEATSSPTLARSDSSVASSISTGTRSGSGK